MCSRRWCLATTSGIVPPARSPWASPWCGAPSHRLCRARTRPFRLAGMPSPLSMSAPMTRSGAASALWWCRSALWCLWRSGMSGTPWTRAWRSQRRSHPRRRQRCTCFFSTCRARRPLKRRRRCGRCVPRTSSSGPYSSSTPPWRRRCLCTRVGAAGALQAGLSAWRRAQAAQSQPRPRRRLRSWALLYRHRLLPLGVRSRSSSRARSRCARSSAVSVPSADLRYWGPRSRQRACPRLASRRPQPPRSHSAATLRHSSAWGPRQEPPPQELQQPPQSRQAGRRRRCRGRGSWCRGRRWRIL
mmetsp:Transcript_69538/g.148724  ORF Transcript_69538/g.148724 Transcript_69538/m.148724 type:complete len:301 (-) Transcript_69538:1971-2873(-)